MEKQEGGGREIERRMLSAHQINTPKLEKREHVCSGPNVNVDHRQTERGDVYVVQVVTNSHSSSQVVVFGLFQQGSNFDQYARAHWCAKNSLQVCCRSWGRDIY